jgi:hypothetical protein
VHKDKIKRRGNQIWYRVVRILEGDVGYYQKVYLWVLEKFVPKKIGSEHP